MAKVKLDRAPTQGCAVYERNYLGGEFLPFYVPRVHMPQIDQQHLPALVSNAYVDGHNPQFENIDPKTLHAHQRVDHHLARSIPAYVRSIALLVSGDDFILDGNHRWWAAVHNLDPRVNIIRINLPFITALDYLLKQPFTFEVGAGVKSV